MIFIDTRSGSKDLLEYIDDAIPTTLKYGDIYFSGNGPEGDIEIGIERKRIGDLIQSITSGRLSGHQLPGLLEEYGKVYIVVEGAWITDRHSGVIKVYRHGKFLPLGSSRFITKRLLGYLTAINALTHICILNTLNAYETAVLIEELYRWWNQPWDKHTSLLNVRRVIPVPIYIRPGEFSQLREIALTLPGIGYDRVRAIEEAFGDSVERMFNASIQDWGAIEGIGKVTAKKAWEALHT